MILSLLTREPVAYLILLFLVLSLTLGFSLASLLRDLKLPQPVLRVGRSRSRSRSQYVARRPSKTSCTPPVHAANSLLLFTHCSTTVTAHAVHTTLHSSHTLPNPSFATPVSAHSHCHTQLLQST